MSKCTAPEQLKLDLAKKGHTTNTIENNNMYIIKLRTLAIKEAMRLKQELCSKNANIVTIESATSGLIASTLSDVGAGGATLYGGFIVYDTDAKRKWAGVRTPNIYNQTTAKEMSEGALLNSRALICVSITGNASPYVDSVNCIGVAHLGVSIRTPTGLKTKTKQINVCRSKYLKKILPNEVLMCKSWINNHTKDTYPPMEDTIIIGQLIRYLFCIESLRFTIQILKKYKGKFGHIEKEDYDDKFTDCHEPSNIINESFKHPIKNMTWPTLPHKYALCSEKSDILGKCSFAPITVKRSTKRSRVKRRTKRSRARKKSIRKRY